MANPAAGALTSEPTVGDLMALARPDDRAAVDGLTVALTWRYEHPMTPARALAAATSGVILSLAVPVLQSNPGVNPMPVAAWLWVLVAGAVTMLTGYADDARVRAAVHRFLAAGRPE